MYSPTNPKSILDIDNITKNDDTKLDSYLQEINSITFESAIHTVLTDHDSVGYMISEITRVDAEIMAFNAGDIDTIHVDEQLTLEISVNLSDLTYNKLSSEKDRLLEKAYEYIRALINKIIVIIKTTFTKYMAVHSKHIEISKEYLDGINGLDLKSIDNNKDLDLYSIIGTIMNSDTSTISSETPYFISNSKTVETIIEKIKDYGNYTSIVRPSDKIILNTVSTELGSARADIMKDWAVKSVSKFNSLFIDKPTNDILNKNIKNSVIVSDIDLDIKEISRFTPFTTDGSTITCLYLTNDLQLRIMRMVLKDIPKDKIVNLENLKPLLLEISKTDIGNLVKEDIRVLEKIERDAKIYLKQVNDDLGTDHGKRSSSFNNTVTMVNAALAVANNRMKLTNNIISIAEKILIQYKG